MLERTRSAEYSKAVYMNIKRSPVLIISGPTATGKTSLAIEVAKKFESEQHTFVVINFDSLLFYQELEIGTAKPTPEERQDVPHLGLDIVSISEEFNASSFTTVAGDYIRELHDQNKIPILVGGSAFYLRALIKGMFESEAVSVSIRAQVQSLFDTGGIELVREKLSEVDPESAQKLHVNDHYRNMRALEHFLSTGHKLSTQDARLKENDPYDFSKSIHPEWDIFHIYLDIPKDEHWDVIQGRTEKMIEAGLEQEVRSLLERGFSPDLKALNSIGYKETLDYIAGRLPGRPAWSERISLSTRQLAKSQRTFFKKVTPKNVYNPLLQKELILADVQAFLCKD